MNPRPSSLPRTAATRPVLPSGGRAVSTLSRGGAGGAHGEGVANSTSSPIHSASGRLIISRAYAPPAKRHRTRGADLKVEKEL